MFNNLRWITFCKSRHNRILLFQLFKDPGIIQSVNFKEYRITIGSRGFIVAALGSLKGANLLIMKPFFIFG